MVSGLMSASGHVVEYWTCDLQVAGSNLICGYSVHQYQLSLPSLRGWLMNTIESLGVNGE